MKKYLIDDCNTKNNEVVALAQDKIMNDTNNIIVTACDVNKNSVGALAGVPVVLEDSLCLKNVLTTVCSKSLFNFTPPYTATAVEKILDAGATIVGKANMAEYGACATTETSYFGESKLTKGGSAVATAIVNDEAVLGYASDCEGNARLCASYENLVAFRPSTGKVSRFGLIGASSCFDMVTPIAKSVKDAVIALDVVQGYDVKDSLTYNDGYYSMVDCLGQDIKGLKIGIVKEFEELAIENCIKVAYKLTLDKLVKAGANLVEVNLPSFGGMLGAIMVLKLTEVTSNLARIDGIKYGYKTAEYSNLQELYVKTRTEGMGTAVKEAIIIGNYVVTGDRIEKYHFKARKIANKIREEVSKIFAECDAIVSPIALNTYDTYVKAGLTMDSVVAQTSFTALASIAGAPAMSVPIADGISIQVIAKPLAECTVVSVASAIEKLVKFRGV